MTILGGHMIIIKGESLKEWNKRVKNYKWDTSGWIQLPEIKEAKVKNKKRIKELELQVDALTIALSDLEDSYRNDVSFTRGIRKTLLERIEDNDKQIHELLVRINKED